MKKKRLAGLVLALPLALLCACGGGTAELTMTAYWYKNHSKEVETNTREELEYAVTFTASESSDALQLKYTDGVYKTTLSDDTVNGEHVYRYTTALNINVQFFLNGAESEVFEDAVTSETVFLSVREHLRPLSSTVTVKSTSPISANPSALRKGVAYEPYNYRMTTTYDEALETASVVYENFETDEDDTELEIDIDGNGTYLDNEQIAFALRSLSMNATVAFRSINPVKQQMEFVHFTQTPTQVTEPASFTLNYFGGETAEEVPQSIQAYQAVLAYDSRMSGQPVTFTYAKSTEPAFRNVMLKMEKPILQSLGTMVYTLKKATLNYNI